MKVSTRNTVAGIFVIGGFLLLLGAVGQSDMYEEAGQILPLAITAKKIIVGVSALLLGAFIGRERR